MMLLSRLRCSTPCVLGLHRGSVPPSTKYTRFHARQACIVQAAANAASYHPYLSKGIGSTVQPSSTDMPGLVNTTTATVTSSSSGSSSSSSGGGSSGGGRGSSGGSSSSTTGVLPAASTAPPAAAVSADPKEELTHSEQRLLAAGYSLQDILARRKRKPGGRQSAASKQRRISRQKRPGAGLSAQHDAAGELFDDRELTPSQRRLLAVGYTLDQVHNRAIEHSSNTSLADPANWQGTRKQILKGRSQESLKLAPYVGWGAPVPQRVAEIALQAAASAAEGPSPVYVWPKVAPVVLSPQLYIGRGTENERNAILQAIESGVEDMSNTHIPLQRLLDCTGAADGSAGRASSTSSSSSSGSSASVSTAALSASAAAAEAGIQVFDLQWLQDRAAADPGAAAVVPDAHQPFTLTLQNPADGLDYVVAHYEPNALRFDAAKNAALLAQIYHGSEKMSRSSALYEEKMAMAGMRVPRQKEGSTRFGRYSGDTGPEPDQFSLSCCPDLLRTGGFRAIASKWMEQLPGVFCARSQTATQDAGLERGPRPGKGPALNFPAPTLLGGPFTSLAVTQNYRSDLHAEPQEHPFSYIVWLDVLSAGSTMEVGYFWLTNGLAFTPLNGSALYTDVRLVPHCSDPSCVSNDNAKAPLYYEGRYGAAFFIKPGVLQENIHQWTEFDEFQQLAAMADAGASATDTALSNE